MTITEFKNKLQAECGKHFMNIEIMSKCTKNPEEPKEYEVVILHHSTMGYMMSFKLALNRGVIYSVDFNGSYFEVSGIVHSIESIL